MSQLKAQVLLWAGRIAKYATLNSLTNKFPYAFVDRPREDPELGDKSRPQRVRFLQWFGFRSVPKVVGAECVVVAPRTGAVNALAVAVDNLSYGPIDLKEGESVMYGVGGSTIKHDQAGKVTVDAAAAQDVVVNGGNLKVARETDPCEIKSGIGGFLAIWMTQVETAINLLAPGTVAPLSSTFLQTPGIQIKSGAGSPRFKA